MCNKTERPERQPPNINRKCQRLEPTEKYESSVLPKDFQNIQNDQ